MTRFLLPSYCPPRGQRLGEFVVSSVDELAIVSTFYDATLFQSEVCNTLWQFSLYICLSVHHVCQSIRLLHLRIHITNNP